MQQPPSDYGKGPRGHHKHHQCCPPQPAYDQYNQYGPPQSYPSGQPQYPGGPAQPYPSGQPQYPGGPAQQYPSAQPQYHGGPALPYPSNRPQYPGGPTQPYPSGQPQYPGGATQQYPSGQPQYPGDRPYPSGQPQYPPNGPPRPYDNQYQGNDYKPPRPQGESQQQEQVFPQPAQTQIPTRLILHLNQSRGADVRKTYLKIKYSGQECRCGTQHTESKVATYGETKEFSLDAESIDIILMEDNIGRDTELAVGSLTINTKLPNEWSGWLKLHGSHNKARSPEVLIDVTVR